MKRWLSTTNNNKGPQTLFDKIWNAHVVHASSPTEALLYVDRHLVHEVTSPQGFAGLRAANRTVRQINCTLAVPDHNVTTSKERLLPGGKRGDDAEGLAQLKALEENVKQFNVPYFNLNDKRQGIVHVVGPEQGLTQPGQIIVCGDSHTATHGAFGALAFGIGSSEVEHVLATQTIHQTKPLNMLIQVNGKLDTLVSSKDLILYIISQIGTAGGNGCVVEFSGPAISGLSMEGRMSMTNMTIEAGARAGLIAPDETCFNYLKGRPFAPQTEEMFQKACTYWRSLKSDAGAKFDKTVVLDAKDVSPCVSWGTNPEQTVSINGKVPDPAMEKDEFKKRAYTRALEYMGLQPNQPMESIEIDSVFIGSCTNGRLEDLRAAALVAKDRKVKVKRAMVVPGSGLVKEQAEAEGILTTLREAGFEIREPGCSMCLGMNGDQLKPQERCASTSNRNFEGRQGRGGRTHLVSPSMAAAAAVSGRLVDVRTLLSKRAFSTSAQQQRATRGRVPWSGAMESFKRHVGQAVLLPQPNIDTDDIIPAIHLKTVTKNGLGPALFEKQRYVENSNLSQENPQFPLNQKKEASILLAGENFGCGSSREHAVWALLDYGIRVVIAPSFADIFYNNSLKNGLLPVVLTKEEIARFAQHPGLLDVDLEYQVVVTLGTDSPFSAKFSNLDEHKRSKLLKGLDEIGETLSKHEKDIAAFEAKRKQELPWLFF